MDAPRGGLSSFSCNKTGIIEAPVDPERLDSTLYTRRNIRYAKDLRANNSMDMVLVVLRLVCGNDGATNRVLAPNKMHKQFVICCDSQAEIVILKRESPYPLRTIQVCFLFLLISRVLLKEQDWDTYWCNERRRIYFRRRIPRHPNIQQHFSCNESQSNLVYG